MEAGETGSDVTLSYTGLVQPEETIQCTFETIGTIASVEVEQGQEVTEAPGPLYAGCERCTGPVGKCKPFPKLCRKNKKNAQESYDNARRTMSQLVAQVVNRTI